MDTTLSAQMRRGDAAALARSLQELSSFGRTAFPEWSAIARRGATSARRGDTEGAREACRDCHRLYRAEYRLHHRDQPLPAATGRGESE